jgi:CrcB protein
VIAAVVIVVGGLAAVTRFIVARALPTPWGVLAVNIIGSAIGGTVLGLAEKAAISDDLRLVLLTGVCGGLTTFSTFSVETIQLVVDRELGRAGASVAGNLVLGIGAATIGYLLAR